MAADTEAVEAWVVFVDVGPSLGAVNRVAVVASDHVVVPLSPDLYSIRGCGASGPTTGGFVGPGPSSVSR